jgi:hypothetical protein
MGRINGTYPSSFGNLQKLRHGDFTVLAELDDNETLESETMILCLMKR